MNNRIFEKCGIINNELMKNEKNIRSESEESKIIYMDNSATTNMKQEVIDEMIRIMKSVYGNPSALYSLGAKAKEEVESSRKKISKILNCKTEEIYFTSSGTEADNLAILGIARANISKGKHIITTKIEHKAVLNSCKKLEKEGFEVTYLNVDETGRISLNELMNTIRSDTILISIMAINNEIGTVQDLEQIGKIARFKGVIFHSDFVQAVGHLPIDVKKYYLDSISISAHKFNGPKGIGMLYVKDSIDFEPIIYGGSQEKGKRAGTENVASIVGMTKALELTYEDYINKNMQISKLRDYFKEKLMLFGDKVKINCDSIYKSCSNLNVCFNGYNSKDMVLRLNMKNICVSSGSACNSSDSKPSHVLLATGMSEQDAKNSVRFSLSIENTYEEIDYVVNIIKEILER